MVSQRNAPKKEFWILLIATDISVFGSFLTYFSVPLIIYSLYSSGIFLAVFELALLIPSLFFGFLIGRWMRGRDVKRLWMLSSLFLGALSLSVFLYLNVWSLFLLNLFSSLIGIVSAISYQSMVPELLSKKDVPWGNNVISLSMSALAIVSPLPAAYLLDFDVRLPFLADALTYFMALGLVSLISIKKPAEDGGSHKPKKSAIEMIRTLPVLRNTIVLGMLVSLIAGGVRLVNVAYFSYFQNYYVMFGLAMVFLYSGDVAVKSSVSLKVLEIKRPYRVMLFSLLFYSSAFLILFLNLHPIITMFGFFLLGVGNGLISPQRASILQTHSPKESMSEILGMVSTVTNSSRMASVIIVGIALSFLPPPVIYLLMGLSIFCVFLLFYPLNDFE